MLDKEKSGMVTIDRLADQLQLPYGSEHYSPVFNKPYVLIDLDSAAAGLDLKAVGTKLNQLNCPSIGITGQETNPPPLAAYCDVLQRRKSDLTSIIDNIR